jgi:hypothetical protein
MISKNISKTIICLVFVLSSPLLRAQTDSMPFLRLSGIDRWEGITTSLGNGGYISYYFSSKTYTDSTLNDGIMFYYGGSEWRGFDPVSNKMYLLNNGVKSLDIDFNVAPGSTFPGGFGKGATISVSGTNDKRTFQGTYGFWPSTDYSVTYQRDIGPTFSRSYMVMSGNWSEFRTSMISQLRTKLNGEILYTPHGHNPGVSFTPIISPSNTFSVLFNVNASHSLNGTISPYVPSFNYLDTLIMEYYYSNGVDSTDIYTFTKKAFALNSFTIEFDSSFLRNGYHLKYRMMVRDKSIVPKFAYSPSDQSFYTLHFEVPVGVENETLPDNFFQIAAYPNPFNNSTTLQIDHFESGEVTVNIYSLTGEKVIEPLSLHKEAGTLTLPIEFNSQPSGVYVADINFVSSTGKMIRKHQKLVYLK